MTYEMDVWYKPTFKASLTEKTMKTHQKPSQNCLIKEVFRFLGEHSQLSASLLIGYFAESD